MMIKFLLVLNVIDGRDNREFLGCILKEMEWSVLPRRGEKLVFEQGTDDAVVSAVFHDFSDNTIRVECNDCFPHVARAALCNIQGWDISGLPKAAMKVIKEY